MANTSASTPASLLTPPPTAAPTPAVAQGSLAGTMTTAPTTTPVPPAPIPVTPAPASPASPTQTTPAPSPQAQATSQAGTQSTATGQANPGALSQAMTAIQNNVANNNKLVTQKNLILKQLYDQPLSDADKTQLDPSLASTLASGDRNAIDFQLKLLNDQIAGRTNTLTQNVGYLTSGYNTAVQQAETAKQNAIQNVQNFVQQYGNRAGSALSSLYGPQYVQQLASMGIDLQGFEQSNNPTINQTRYIGTTGGTAGYAANDPVRIVQNNNPTAFTTDVAKTMGLIEGQDYIAGTPFTDSTGQTLYTAQLLGDPIQTTIKGLDQGGFYTASGAPRWSYVSQLPQDIVNNWANATPDQKEQVVQDMYQFEGGKGTLGGTQISATPPSGPQANVIDPTTGISPNGLYSAALQYAATGNMPSLGSSSSSAQVKSARQQIISIAGAINAASGGTIAGNKAEIASNASALTQQSNYFNTIQRSVNTVDQNIKLLQEAAGHVNNSSVPIANQLTNDVKLSTGDGALNAFNAALQTVRSEYSNILARGGTVTDQTRGEATNLLPSNLDADQLNQVISVLQSEGQNVLTAAQGQVDAIQHKINNIVQAPMSDNTGTDDSDYQKYLSTITINGAQ